MPQPTTAQYKSIALLLQLGFLHLPNIRTAFTDNLHILIESALVLIEFLAKKINPFDRKVADLLVDERLR